MLTTQFLSFLSNGISTNGPKIFFDYKLKGKEIKPYLINPEKIPSSQDLNINAFIPDKINEFERVFKSKIEEVSKHILPLYFTNVSKGDEEIMTDVIKETFTERCVTLRWEEFKAGKSFDEFSRIEVDPSEIIAEELNEVSPPQTDTARRLRSRFFQKKIKPCSIKKKISDGILPAKPLSIPAQVFNTLLSVREDISSKEMSWLEFCDGIGSVIDEIEEEADQSNIKTAKNAARLSNKLLKAENERLQSQPLKPKPPKRQSFTKPTKKIELKSEESQKPNSVPLRILSPLEKTIQQLNSDSWTLEYTLAPRVRRWNTLDPKKIKEFEDGGKKQYQNYSDEELLKFRNDHRLNGIERILSDPILRQKYSSPYQYTSKNEEIQTGRSFTVVQDTGSKRINGKVFVGINEKKEIYHAMFEKTKEKNPSPENKAKMIQAYKDNKSAQVEEKWDQISMCTFSLENEDIKMTIGRDKKDQTIFYLKPQNTQA